MTVRSAAVAGTWYPGTAGALARDVDEYLGLADEGPQGDVRALIAPHAGLMFSGPVGAWAYKAVRRGSYDVAVLVGPSHFAAFDGVALFPEGSFDTPLGPALVDPAGSAAMARFDIVKPLESPHRREHSLEMQLPFLRRVLPHVPVVPLLMGYQDRATIDALAAAIGGAFADRRALLVASTDLSHYFEASVAERLDSRVQALVDAFDVEGLLALFEQYPERERGRYVACGGGAAIAVMQAARLLGAPDARVLHYAHSGHVSGDHEAVVGYLAAAVGHFRDAD